MLTELEQALADKNAEAVQNAVFNLGALRSEQPIARVASDVLAILRRPEMWQSDLAGHVLNYFEFEAQHLPQSSKDECTAFLENHGDEFTHVHGAQVVSELRLGSYLQPVPVGEPRRKLRHAR